MKNNSFWDNFRDYIKFQRIVPVVILIIVTIVIIAKVLFEKIIS